MQNNYVQEDYCNAHIILPADQANGALLLGDFNSAIDPDTLSNHHIKTIITAAEGLAHLQIDPSIKHITFPLLDNKTENIAAFFEKSHQTIQHSLGRGGVLVHCAAGISRSATLVIAYLMKKNRWAFRRAIDFVRKKRPCVCPNLGFEMQLKAYEKELAPSISPNPTNSRLVHRSRNIITADFDGPHGLSKEQNPQRGASFPTIPQQTRNLLRRKVATRNGLPSREKEPEHPGSRHSSILKDNLIISSMTGYQHTFHERPYESKQKKQHQTEEEQPILLARNLAKMMFGSHMHKWTSSKVIEEHVHSLTRARRRLAHLRKN